jgi:hypothetical protein
MGRRPKDWKPSQPVEGSNAEPEVSASMLVRPRHLTDDASTTLTRDDQEAFARAVDNVDPHEGLVNVFGGVVSPAPEVINTVQANEPVPYVFDTGESQEDRSARRERMAAEEAADEPMIEPVQPIAYDENEPGRWVPFADLQRELEKIPGMAEMIADEETKLNGEWLVSPSVSIRAGLTAAIANPGPWPNAERLGRAQRHMEELINALPEAIEAANGLLKEDLETLRDILA